jgi:NAD(P)-dependent dehydrogenase (short-subunit alcohol dehydrogenase family)
VDLGLDGKVVMVTGGSDGLGRALCHRLIQEGASVALCARDRERLSATADELRALAAALRAPEDETRARRTDPGALGATPVLADPCDVTSADDLRQFVERAVERFGRIDGLVNNAGRSAGKPVAETTDADWEEDLLLKLHAAVRLTRLVLPHMTRPGGAIVNVLAIAAKTPGAGSGPSSVSRAAGMALTKALSKELGPDGIRANAVLIGLIESGQWERVAATRGVAVEDLYLRMAVDAGIPLGRVGRAAEFADTVSYLLSSRASYVTGAALNLDGGLCAAV